MLGLDISIEYLVLDIVYGFVLFGLILFTVYFVKRYPNVWVNRKIIHLSSVPAVVFYMYIFKEPYVFLFFAIIFTIMLFVKHVKNDLSEWFQLKDNYGEVFFTVSYGALSILFWPRYRIFAGVVMLFMAIGDSVTGIVRSRFVHERRKHWTGSIAMFVVSSLIAIYYYGWVGIVFSLIATLAEAQPYLDDNLSVPLITSLLGLYIIL